MRKTYSWKTTKTNTGFQWFVEEYTDRTEPNELGHYVDTRIIHTGHRATRAQASGIAKKVCVGYRRAS